MKNVGTLALLEGCELMVQLILTHFAQTWNWKSFHLLLCSSPNYLILAYVSVFSTVNSSFNPELERI